MNTNPSGVIKGGQIYYKWRFIARKIIYKRAIFHCHVDYRRVIPSPNLKQPLEAMFSYGDYTYLGPFKRCLMSGEWEYIILTITNITSNNYVTIIGPTIDTGPGYLV